jgi:raffinose/stachyose/melibiose transport system permease protein
MTPLSLVTPSARPSNGARERRLLGGRKSFYLYIAPATLLFAAFVVYPILSVVLVSFVDRDSASLGTGAFANYQAVFADPIFWKAARNMVFWAVLTITIQMVIGGTLAYLIEQHARRSKAVLRTAFLIPMVTSASVVAIVWQQFYAPTYGPLENLLKGVGISMGGASLLGDPSTAIFAIIVINIWMYTGFSMLLYIVGLHRISSEILDAARADGATGLRLARHILIPMLAPTTKSLLLLGIIGALQTFALVFLTTKGGPNHASDVFGTQIFRAAFELNHEGYAAALSSITLGVAFAATVLQLRILHTGLSPSGREG